jgi:hypothetical protein
MLGDRAYTDAALYGAYTASYNEHPLCILPRIPLYTSYQSILETSVTSDTNFVSRTNRVDAAATTTTWVFKQNETG